MGIQSSVTKEYTSSLTMKVMGFFAITLAVCLVSMTVSQPLFFEAGTTAAFTAAGGLVFTNAAGTAVATIPAAALLLGLGAKKVALYKLLQDHQQQQQRAGHHH